MLFCLCLLSAVASSQCSVTSIVYHDFISCDTLTNKFKIPVSVTYTGTPTKVQVSVNEKDTTYNTQVWNHFSSNSFTFLIYDNADGAERNIDVTATLLGGSCTQQFKIEPYNYTALSACSELVEEEENPCPETLTLSDEAVDGVYQAVSTIESSQIIISNTSVHIHAGTSVTLLPGFEAKQGATLLINTETCQE